MLALFNVTEMDAGEYICKVSNYIGQANQSAWLTVLPKQQGNNVFCVCVFLFFVFVFVFKKTGYRSLKDSVLWEAAGSF